MALRKVISIPQGSDVKQLNEAVKVLNSMLPADALRAELVQFGSDSYMIIGGLKAEEILKKHQQKEMA